jgi:hypothetical protein
VGAKAKILVHEGDDDGVMTLACFPEMFHLWMDRALEFIQPCIDVGKKSTIPPVRSSAGLRGAFVHNVST